jgi:tRNA(Arg) A34 adenosine deaminase TadA
VRPADLRYLRAAIAVSRSARANGNEPYGAVLVDSDGTVLGSAENTQVTGGDCTGHAETNLLRAASPRIDRATLARATLYASGEPCPMCAGAIYWSGVGRVVYALSLDSMLALAGPGADELILSCREVLARGTRNIEVLGPQLEDEARRVFEESSQ